MSVKAKRIFAAVAFIFCFAHGFLALHFGEDTQGDQLYYHYYAPYAFVHGRDNVDIAAGGLAGFNNPLLYLPFYFLATFASARFTGFCIGFWEGLNFVILFAIGLMVFHRLRWPWRVAYSMLGVAFCLVGPMYSLEIGRTFGDDWVTVPYLLGIAFLLRSGQSPRPATWAGWGGALIGVSCALKLPGILFAAILFGAFIATRPAIRTPAAALLGSIAGFLVADGFWLYHEFKLFGNPVFPFFNGLFKSPYFAAWNWHDQNWKRSDLADFLRLPITFLDSNDKVSDNHYRDSFWLLFFVVLFAYAAVRLVLRKASLIDRRHEIVLLIFPLLGFTGWAFFLHYARYMYIVTMMAPLAVIVMVQYVVRSNLAAVIVLTAAVVLVGSTSQYLPMTWAKLHWKHKWYEVGDLGIPEDGIVILRNGIGMIAGSVPASSRMIGLGTNYFFSGNPGDGRTRATFNRIHEAMWSQPNRVFQVELTTLPSYYHPEIIYPLFGFALDSTDCHDVPSNLGAFRVCRLKPVARGEPPTSLPE